MSTDTPTIEPEPQSFIDKVIADQLADQKKTNAEFQEFLAQNAKRLAKMQDSVANARSIRTGMDTVTPEMKELSLFLHQNPMLVPYVLRMAKDLGSRVQAAVEAELAKTVGATT